VTGRHLQIVVCGAGPAAEVTTLIAVAQECGWTAAVTATTELIGRYVPTVIAPFVNSALTGRTSFKRSVAVLRDEGVRVVAGLEHGWEPHPPGTGTDKQAIFPWRAAFDLAEQMAG